MRTYTINEAIEAMADSIQILSDGYGTWKVKGNLGIRSTGEYVEDYFNTHDDYESTEDRNERAARKIIESWVDDDECPDNVIVTADNSTIYVLDEDEKEFAESETYNLAMLVDGRAEAFTQAFDNRDEEETDKA